MNMMDRMPFPENPREMYGMLILEEVAKVEGGFTQDGINGYMLFELLKEGGELGTVARRISQPHRSAAGDRSTDNTGVSVR
jgi:hypothetical protein